MNRGVRGLVAVLLVGGGVVLAAPTPAGAAVTVTSAGTVVTVTATGNQYVTFGCDAANKFKVGSTLASPAVSCASVTRVNVNGDTGNQTVLGDSLNGAAFATNPYLVASTGAGDDYVSETDRSDTISTGADNDTVFIQAGGVNNTAVSLGTGTNDAAYFDGTDLNDTISASSVNANVSVTVNNSNGGSTRVAQAVDRVFMRGNKGNDTLTGVGVTAASSLGSVDQAGGPGNDTLSASPIGGQLLGDDGTNTYYGGVAQDQIYTTSDTDILHLAGGGNDEVFDQDNGRSGGRTIDGNGANNYFDYQKKCDAQLRIRPGTAGAIKMIGSLCRPGVADLPNTFTRVGTYFSDNVDDKALADIVVPAADVDVRGDGFNNDLIDVTVPTGTWLLSGVAPAQVTINPDAPGLGTVTVQNTAQVVAHGPWTNKNQGFGHRVIRDLLFRFGTAAERDAIRDQLTGGTKTRSQVVASLMNTDEYRGTDVDRVFVRFLHRKADPGGRTYWINGLRNGKSLRKFRAQLFGSNEYFANSFDDNTVFVKNAYFDVLGRVPDPAGLAYWVNKIDTGTGRGSVANSFLASTEARRAIVKDQFLRFALRTPSAAEADPWIATLASDTGEQQLIAFLAASGAYYAAG